MRLLLVAPSNSIHTRRWVKNSLDSGIDVYLVDQDPFGERPPSLDTHHYFNIELSGLPSRSGLTATLGVFRRQYLLFRKLNRSLDIDLVHIHWLFGFLPFLFTSSKKAYIATPWGSDIQYIRTRTKKSVVKGIINSLVVTRVIKKASLLHCDSHQIASQIEEFGGDSRKIRVVYFGTDVVLFNPHARSASLRKKFGADSDTDVLIISTRSHEPVYDIPTFIRSAQELDGCENIKYVIAGSGSLTNHLKSLVHAAGLSSRFHFTGKLDDQEFLSATASCDIYVSTSTSDGGLAASTAEAMASGLPVVITNFGENSIWLDSESAGLLFEVGNSSELAEKLLHFVTSDEARRTAGAVARKIIVDRNNSVTEWGKILDAYTEVTKAI
jgi:glycosyltransferase involved in cell wall biosynthesis